MTTGRTRLSRSGQRGWPSFLVACLIVVGLIAGVSYYFANRIGGREFTKPVTPMMANNATQVKSIGQLNVEPFPDDVRFSADSRRLMISTARGAMVWETEAGGLKLTVHELPECVTTSYNFCFMDTPDSQVAALSPDGRWLVMALRTDDYRETHIWDVNAGRSVMRFFNRPDMIGDFMFTPDSTFLLYNLTQVADCSGICAYNLQTQIRATLASGPGTFGMGNDAQSGESYVYYSQDDHLMSVNITTTEATELASDVSGMEVVDVSLDNQWAALYNRNKPYLIELWNLTSRQRSAMLTINGQWAGLEFSRDSTKLLTYGSNRVYLWDVLAGKSLFEPRYADYAALSPDGSLIAAISYTTVDLIDAKTGKTLHTIDRDHDAEDDGTLDMTPGSEPNKIRFSPDGTLLASETGALWGIPKR